MKYTPPPVSQRIIIKPGDHFVASDTRVLQTLLGSCVAACLYDDAAGVSGMNHFLLANKRYSKALEVNVTDAGRYGIHAMELLINDMLKKGAQRQRLRAKIFGGSTIVNTGGNDNFFCVGEVNIRFIREFLHTEGIPVISEDLGGKLGRVIQFHTDTHAVYRRFIAQTAAGELEKTEHQYWQHEVERAVLEAPTVVLFK
ncbi:MAG: chemotaxis protein CheD [Spirochaetes bacterium]|nr:chemotaxis protein CheD [Spirochaetota bacterium]MBU0954637.1 chemotaxis protein CheD [Spirochaetota bacterium]